MQSSSVVVCSRLMMMMVPISATFCGPWQLAASQTGLGLVGGRPIGPVPPPPTDATSIVPVGGTASIVVVPDGTMVFTAFVSDVVVETDDGAGPEMTLASSAGGAAAAVAASALAA